MLPLNFVVLFLSQNGFESHGETQWLHGTRRGGAISYKNLESSMRVPCWYSSTLRKTVHQEVVSGYQGAYRDSGQKVQGPLAGMLAWVDRDKLRRF